MNSADKVLVITTCKMHYSNCYTLKMVKSCNIKEFYTWNEAKKYAKKECGNDATYCKRCITNMEGQKLR